MALKEIKVSSFLTVSADDIKPKQKGIESVRKMVVEEIGQTRTDCCPPGRGARLCAQQPGRVRPVH